MGDTERRRKRSCHSGYGHNSNRIQRRNGPGNIDSCRDYFG